MIPSRSFRFFAALRIVALSSLLATPSAYSSPAHTKGREVSPAITTLQPGDYVWHPEFSPSGPVVVLVSIPDQLLFLYRNGVRIGRSTVSTGKPGKRTPTGVFTILQKKVDHESSIYKGAKMPHMQRLTWSGIAMHAGNLPGYPASAGCVRLPVDFAAKLYSVTTLGTTVIIADHESSPTATTQPGLLFSSKNGESGSFGWTPEKAPKGPVSIIVSSADRSAYVYRNGVEIGRARLDSRRRVSGTYVYSALAANDAHGQREWEATASIGRRAPNLQDFADDASIPPAFLTDVRAVIVPGTTLVLTDLPVSGRTHSSSGFKILATQ